MFLPKVLVFVLLYFVAIKLNATITVLEHGTWGNHEDISPTPTPGFTRQVLTGVVSWCMLYLNQISHVLKVGKAF